MSFQTRTDFGDNRCDECLGLRFSPTSAIRHFIDCSQHPANLPRVTPAERAAALDVAHRVTALCVCGEPARIHGLCHLCAADMFDPEHVEGRVDV